MTGTHGNDVILSTDHITMAVSSASIKKVLLNAFPHFSIAVAALVISAQLALIGLVLISPASLGLLERIYSHGTFNETVHLNAGQSIGLGIATIIIILEGVLIGLWTSYLELRMSVFSAYVIKPSTESETDLSPSTTRPLVQQDPVNYSTFLQSQYGHVPSSFRLRTFFSLDSDLKYLVKKRVAHYIAEILFEVVQFLVKWTLALVVIRGNWLSVGVTIAGGIGYPIIQFWQSLLAAEGMKTIKPSIHPAR